MEFTVTRHVEAMLSIAERNTMMQALVVYMEDLLDRDTGTNSVNLTDPQLKEDCAKVTSELLIQIALLKKELPNALFVTSGNSALIIDTMFLTQNEKPETHWINSEQSFNLYRIPVEPVGDNIKEFKIPSELLDYEEIIFIDDFIDSGTKARIIHILLQLKGIKHKFVYVTGRLDENETKTFMGPCWWYEKEYEAEKKTATPPKELLQIMSSSLDSYKRKKDLYSLLHNIAHITSEIRQILENEKYRKDILPYNESEEDCIHDANQVYASLIMVLHYFFPSFVC